MMYENDDMTPMLWQYATGGANGTVNYSLPVELSSYIQKVGNQSGGYTGSNPAGIWADPGDSVPPKDDGLATSPTFTLTKQTFVAPYSTNGNNGGLLYGGGTADPDGIAGDFYTPGFPASNFQSPAGCFTFVETANEASDLGDAFPGVKRPVDEQNPSFPLSALHNGQSVSSSAHYGGADCITDRNAGAEVACTHWFNIQTAGNLWYGNQSPHAFADGHVKTMDAFQSAGTGVGGVNPNNNKNCDVQYPCGGWIPQGQ